ncbi:MAG: cytochrome c oxidase assembly protein [Dehalococcoidia bacterium]
MHRAITVAAPEAWPRGGYNRGPADHPPRGWSAMGPLTGIAWWPLADGSAWSGAWRPHPAVWLALALAVGAFVLARRREEAEAARDHRRPAPGRPRLFALALVMLWASLDWPLGTLAAGYLASAAAAQYLLLTLAVAPLLLASWPGGSAEAGPPSELRRRLSHPLTGALVFAAVLFATHAPALVDPIRGHAAGALLLDAAWLGAGLLLWRPVVGHSRTRRLTYITGIAYLFVPFILPKAPGLVFALADGAIFEVYGDAPRVGGLSVVQDMQLAGILLWSAGTVMIFVSLGIIYARWLREDRRMNAPESLGVPADPEVVELLFATPGGWVAVEQLIAIVHSELQETPGTLLEFERRPAAEAGGTDTVAAVLSLALDPEAEADLTSRVDRAFEGYLGRLPAGRATSIRALLIFEVAAFTSRVA